MKKLWYLVEVIIIIIGAICGEIVPINLKYITGFIAGCLAVTVDTFTED